MTISRPHSAIIHAVALEYEFAQEQATALGRLGRALEAALAALSDYESANPQHDEGRAKLVQAASEALWYFIVQREACGLCDPRPVMREYRVPSAVLARMGAFGYHPGSTRAPPVG